MINREWGSHGEAEIEEMKTAALGFFFFPTIDGGDGEFFRVFLVV